MYVGWRSSFFMLIGRILMAAIFLLSAYEKVMNYNATEAYMTSKGLPVVPLLLVLSIIIEFIGGLSLLIGYKVRALSIILILYLIPVTLIMHDFWMMSDLMQRKDNMYHFFKNLAIMGGLLYVASSGAGFFSFDRCRYTCKKEMVVQKEPDIRT